VDAQCVFVSNCYLVLDWIKESFYCVDPQSSSIEVWLAAKLEKLLRGGKYKEFFLGKEKLSFLKYYILNLKIKYV